MDGGWIDGWVDGLIPESGRSVGEGIGYPLQDSCTGAVGEGGEGEAGPGPGREQGGRDGEGASRLREGGRSQALSPSEDLRTVMPQTPHPGKTLRGQGRREE